MLKQNLLTVTFSPSSLIPLELRVHKRDKVADLNTDSFTQTTTTSWLSRISPSLMGVLIGIILLPCAIVLLSCNEGRSVIAAAGLKRGLGAKDLHLFARMVLNRRQLVTWACRIGGFLLLLIGFSLIMGPLSMLVAFLPLLEGLVGFGTFLVALGLAIAITLVTIALAWIASRSLLGGGILLAAAAEAWAIRSIGVKKKAAAAGA